MFDTLTIPADAPPCPDEEHSWTDGVYVPAAVARICETCGRVEFPPF